jgi:mono/diheme cytochrome c family protein
MKRLVSIAAVLLIALVAFAAGALLSVSKRAPQLSAPSPTNAEGAAPIVPIPSPHAVVPTSSMHEALEGAELARATQLFATNCASCHLASGTGSPHHRRDGIPDFTDPAWHAEHSDAEMRASVENGVGPVMPAFNKRLGPDEIALVVRYLHGFPSRGGGTDRASNQSSEHAHETHGGHTH